MDFIVDLRKNGTNFAILSNTTNTEYSVQLPNKGLPVGLKEQLAQVYRYLFDKPFDDEASSLLLRYQEGIFKKVFTPSIVRGNTEHSVANNPDLIYIRWGDEFKPLYFSEKKSGGKITVSFELDQGYEESSLDFTIESYNFHGEGEKYLDPALVVSFLDEQQNSYTMPLAIRVVAEKTDSIERPDYTNLVRMALKRGAKALIEKIAPVVDFSTLPECIDFSQLPKMEAIALYGKDSFVSKAGKPITKLLVETLSLGKTQVWCPYSLVNFVNSEEFMATSEKPYLLIYLGNETNQNTTTGAVYNNPVLAIGGGDDFANSLFNLNSIPLGTLVSKDQAETFLKESTELILDKYRFAKTLNDRDLEEGVAYVFLSYEAVLTKQGTTAYRLNLVHPVSKTPVKIWCPNNLIATLKCSPSITPENPSSFKVLSKKTRQTDGRVFAESQILLSENALPGKVFAFG